MRLRISHCLFSPLAMGPSHLVRSVAWRLSERDDMQGFPTISSTSPSSRFRGPKTGSVGCLQVDLTMNHQQLPQCMNKKTVFAFSSHAPAPCLLHDRPARGRAKKKDGMKHEPVLWRRTYTRHLPLPLASRRPHQPSYIKRSTPLIFNMPFWNLLAFNSPSPITLPLPRQTTYLCWLR